MKKVQRYFLDYDFSKNDKILEIENKNRRRQLFCNEVIDSEQLAKISRVIFQFVTWKSRLQAIGVSNKIENPKP